MDAAVTAEDVERTAREMSWAQWGVAGVVMAGSMAAGGLAFHYLGEPWGLGVLTAAAVDLALAVWLRMASRLRAVGVRSAAGWVLEIAAACMTGYLNLGAAVFKGIDPDSPEARWLLGIAHGFLPVLLILVTVACGDAHLKLVNLRRDREAAEQAARDAKLAADRSTYEAEQRKRADLELRRANGELVDAKAIHDAATQLRQAAVGEKQAAEQDQREAARLRADAEAEVAATQAAVAQLAKRAPKTEPKPVPTRKSRKPATPEQRRQWVRDERAAGRNPAPADVNKQFGPPGNGWRIVADVDRELQTEIDKQRGLHLVESSGTR